MYRVNVKFTNLIRMSIPLGVALLSGYFLDSLAPVKNFSFLFLAIGLVGNYYYPEIVSIQGKNLSIKLVLSKKFKEFAMEGLEISVDKRARYLILNLDRKYRLDITTMSKDLYYQLKPYIIMFT